MQSLWSGIEHKLKQLKLSTLSTICSSLKKSRNLNFFVWLVSCGGRRETLDSKWLNKHFLYTGEGRYFVLNNSLAKNHASGFDFSDKVQIRPLAKSNGVQSSLLNLLLLLQLDELIRLVSQNFQVSLHFNYNCDCDSKSIQPINSFDRAPLPFGKCFLSPTHYEAHLGNDNKVRGQGCQM